MLFLETWTKIPTEKKRTWTTKVGSIFCPRESHAKKAISFIVIPHTHKKKKKFEGVCIGFFLDFSHHLLNSWENDLVYLQTYFTDQQGAIPVPHKVCRPWLQRNGSESPTTTTEEQSGHPPPARRSLTQFEFSFGKERWVVFAKELALCTKKSTFLQS